MMGDTTICKYSNRLGVLSHSQFQAAMDRFDLGELVRAEPIPFGNFGQNVFLTGTEGKYASRGAPHYPWQFPKERFFTQLLHEHTSAPVPWPYLLDPSDDIFGWSYVIMPRMPGMLLIDPNVRAALGPEDRQAIAHAMGETLARLQALAWPSVGEYDWKTDTIRPLDVEYGEWIISRIRHNLQLAVRQSDRTTDADVRWVEDVISQGQKALDIPFQPCFVMQDYKEGNATVECMDGL
jgi:hygromycin-B 7''-O-kinase